MENNLPRGRPEQGELIARKLAANKGKLENGVKKRHALADGSLLNGAILTLCSRRASIR